jgi:hypothetical protein
MKDKGWLTEAFADTAPDIYPGTGPGPNGCERRRRPRGLFGKLLTSTRAYVPWARFASPGRRRR